VSVMTTHFFSRVAAKGKCLHWVAGSVALFLAFSPGLLHAQANTPPASNAEAVKDASAPHTWELDIAGGVLRRQDGKTAPATLATVIGYLRDIWPANVVLAPGVGEVRVSDLKLSSFQWETALEALRVASGEAFTWTRRPDGAGGPRSIDPTTGQPVSPASSESDLYVLTPDPVGPAARSRRVVEVFNLSGYLHGQTAERVSDNLSQIQRIVIDTIEQLHEGAPAPVSRPHFQYHAGSSLLVVIGRPEEVEVARKVVLALPDASASRDANPPGPALNDQFRRRYGLPPAGSGIPQPSPGPNPAR
jgi:hypothetical protein